MTTEARFRCRLTPRAERDGVDGVVDGILRIRVAAPPVDGAANAALLRLLASVLDVPKRSVRLVSGESSRVKVVAVVDVDPASIVARWPGLRV